MKDLKNIIVDLWELFFPFLVRFFVSMVILSYLLKQGHGELKKTATYYLQTFIGVSKSFLTEIKLESFIGVYLLIVFIFLCYTFNSLLTLLNSIFRVSIFWTGYARVAPLAFVRLYRYFPELPDDAFLENEIRLLTERHMRENTLGLQDVQKRFHEDLTRFGKYLDVVVFEVLFTVILVIFYGGEVSLPKTFFVLMLLLAIMFFLLARTALVVRSFIQREILTIEAIISQEKKPVNNDSVREKERASIKRYSGQQWWGIDIRIIGDIRETFKNFGSFRLGK